MPYKYNPATGQMEWVPETEVEKEETGQVNQPYVPPAATGNTYTQPGAYVPPAATGQTYTAPSAPAPGPVSPPAAPAPTTPAATQPPAPTVPAEEEPTEEWLKPGIHYKEIINNDPNSPLNGRITGYEEYQDGKLVRTWDYTSYYQKLQNVEAPQTYSQWLTGQGLPGVAQQDITETKPYKGISDIVETISQPGFAESELASAEEATAKRLGYASAADMRARMSQWEQNIAGGSAAMQGMTDQERGLMERMRSADIRQIETSARRQLDQILSGATGNSTQRALMQSNTFIQQIRDAELQADWQIMTMNYQRKTDAFNEQFAMLQDLRQRGQVSDDQIIQMYRNNRLDAFQGYATQVAAILQQNEQYLSMYSADLDRIRLASEQIYQDVQTSLGIDSAMRDAMADQFNQFWDSRMAPLLEQEAQANIAAAQGAKGRSIFQGILSILGFGIGAALMFVPGMQGAGVALMGAGVTGGATALAGAT